jgi:arylsulfatase A-like enzyme
MRWIALSLLSAAAGCSPSVEFGPGSSLLDNLSDATVITYPTSNLPPAIAARVQKPFPMMSSIPAESWGEERDAVPAEYSMRLQEAGDVRYWSAGAGRLPTVRGSTAEVFHGDRLLTWIQGAPFPGLHAWYDPAQEAVFALAKERPPGVELLFTADPKAVVADYEAGYGGTANPEAPRLTHRVELSSVSRPALLLPAPAVLSSPSGRLAADELELAVAVADRSYRLANGVLSSAPGGSDGVEFRLEVKTWARSTTVWRREVKRQELGQWIEANVDLRAFRDRKVTLILRTTPGASGDNAFDYALWSGLRFRGPARRLPDQPHVVLVVIDALRADRMSCYGSSRATTPRIDRWIRQRGVVFSDALATASWTLPSTASILTGLAPHQHGVYDTVNKLSDQTLSLATRLRASGYETYSFTDSPFFRRDWGLDQGFDRNQDDGDVSHWTKALEIIRSRRSERPLLVFLHTASVHAPYEFDSRFLDQRSVGRSRYYGQTITYENCIFPYLDGELDLSDADKRYINALYDASVARMDDVVGGFLEQLETVLDERPALVVFTTDHGEEFWEHNRMNHGDSLHGELLRVPFLVRFPEPRDIRVSADPVSHLDIVPTVLDYVGLDVPRILPGRSLRAPIPKNRPRTAQLTEKHYSLQLGAWKLIRGAERGPRWTPDSIELFDLAHDPGEQDNVADSEPARVDELDRLWKEYLLRYPAGNEYPARAAEPAPEALDSLRALGYVR